MTDPARFVAMILYVNRPLSLLLPLFVLLLSLVQKLKVQNNTVAPLHHSTRISFSSPFSTRAEHPNPPNLRTSSNSISSPSTPPSPNSHSRAPSATGSNSSTSTSPRVSSKTPPASCPSSTSCVFTTITGRLCCSTNEYKACRTCSRLSPNQRRCSPNWKQTRLSRSSRRSELSHACSHSFFLHWGSECGVREKTILLHT